MCDHEMHKISKSENSVPCNFTHFLPADFDLRGLPKPSATLEIETQGNKPCNVQRSSGVDHTEDVSSHMLFLHNRILCNEISRLRKELASDSYDTSAFPSLRQQGTHF